MIVIPENNGVTIFPERGESTRLDVVQSDHWAGGYKITPFDIPYAFGADYAEKLADALKEAARFIREKGQE